MERVGEWRLVESDEPEAKAEPPKPEAAGAATTWRALALLGGAAVLAMVGAAIWVTLPQGGVTLDVAGRAGTLDLQPTGDLPGAAAAPTSEPSLVVDVEGAVVRPGVHTLSAGSRVADAIAAAGGYSSQVDIAAAAGALNLAERVSDGQKIHVPARGEGPSLSGAATDAPSGESGLIDINHASSEELDTLPGIGPVTAAKIIAAREELPFASIDDLDARDVVGPSTLAAIRDLITVTP